MSELPQKTSMGGGGGPTGGGGGGYKSPGPGFTYRDGFKNGMEYGKRQASDEARAREAIKSSISSSQKIKPYVDKPMGAVAIGMGAAAGAGVVAKKRKDAEKTEAYKRKPRMADAPPKINPRKAYQD